HIYPYSRSFDDSYMNKVLVFTKQNQEKLNKTPFEAFGNDSTKWQKIEVLAKNLPEKKQKRILDKNYKDKEQKDFKDRNLNDTRYIARLVLN
ncbi:type II CRISPR RNA-guided endonuclease Cas9, partial [Campylobacter jejuni]